VAFWVYLGLFLGVVVALSAPRIARTLPPRTGVWLLSAASVTSAAGLLGSLTTIALTGAARVPSLASEGHVSAVAWRHVDPIAAWAATVAAIVIGVAIVLFANGVRRELVAGWGIRKLVRTMAGDDRLVVVDDDYPHAYAVGGRNGRIVVSRGLLRELSADERRAVLAHETAHLRSNHHVHLRVVRVAAALNPLLRPCVPVAQLAVERWADEDTAAVVGDRTLVARALVRAALAGATRKRAPHGTLAHTASDVGQRVAALMQAPPRPRWIIAVATLALLLATAAAPIYAADSFDNLLNSAATSGSTSAVR
jgi:peptidase M48-like protein